MSQVDNRPIIVTAQFDADADALFQRRREQFFPPQQNFIPAHLTLFHNLPGEEEEAVVTAIASEVSGQGVMEAEVTELMMLGRGVAYRIRSEALVAFRNRLVSRFKEWLTRQDAQGFRPHVTVQNKVSPAEARGTCAILERDFAPFDARIEGIQLWRYDGGPWQPLGALAFHPV